MVNINWLTIIDRRRSTRIMNLPSIIHASPAIKNGYWLRINHALTTSMNWLRFELQMFTVVNLPGFGMASQLIKQRACKPSLSTTSHKRLNRYLPVSTTMTHHTSSGLPAPAEGLGAGGCSPGSGSQSKTQKSQEAQSTNFSPTPLGARHEPSLGAMDPPGADEAWKIGSFFPLFLVWIRSIYHSQW